MNITEIHVLGFYNIGSKTFFNLEVTEGIEVFATSKATWGEEQVKDFCNDENIKVTYEEFENEEDESLETYLSQLGVGYIEVQIDADSSGEHDVNLHEFKFTNGGLERDFVGKHIKTYKNEKSAIKFAKSFNMPLVLT